MTEVIEIRTVKGNRIRLDASAIVMVVEEKGKGVVIGLRDGRDVEVSASYDDVNRLIAEHWADWGEPIMMGGAARNHQGR